MSKPYSIRRVERVLYEWSDYGATGYAKDVIRDLLSALEQAERDRDRALKALDRIGSSEAFDVSRALNQETDAELIIRMDFATTEAARIREGGE